MPKAHDYTGEKFGHWTVEKKDNIKGKWIAICECGERHSVFIGNLKRGLSTKCCKCQAREASVRVSTHGESKTKLYRVWLTIRNRCYNKNVKSYKDYGARGITVCEEWRHDFVAFSEWSKKNGYKEGLEIDRIDNYAGYSPNNCRWVTRLENAENKRTTRKAIYGGELLPVTVIERRLGVRRGLISSRLRRGWSIEESISIPAKVGNNQNTRRMKYEQEQQTS